MLANQDAQIVTNQVQDNAILCLADLNSNIKVHGSKNITQELLCLVSRCQLPHPCQNPGRPAANQSQKALARLRQHLKLNHISRNLQLGKSRLLRLIYRLSCLFNFNSHQSYLFFLSLAEASSTSTASFFSPRNMYHCCAIWQRFMVTQ